MNTDEKLSVTNTSEFKATVDRVEVKGTGNDEYGIIYSKEYGDKLTIYNIKNTLDINDFNSLKRGQVIYFRIEDDWIELYKETSFMKIVSLRTAEKEISTLNDYNEYDKHLLFLDSIRVIVIIMFLIVISAHCILLLRGINIFHKLKRMRKICKKLKI